MSIFYKSCSYNNLIEASLMDNNDIKIPSLSKKVKKANPKNKNKPNYLHLKLLTTKNIKYSNNSLFSKREIEFKKTLKKNKTTFIYKKCSLFDELFKGKTYKNICNKNNKSNNKNKLKKNNSMNSPTYLTEYVYINKNNKNSINSFKNKTRSHYFEIDKSDKSNNKINNTNYIENKADSLYNNYISFCRGQITKNKSSHFNEQEKNAINKKINLKLSNPNYALKIFGLETKKEKSNKKKVELEYKHLFKKNNYLNNYRKKENEKFYYLDSFRDYLIEKINFTIFKDKKNFLGEEMENELNLIEKKEKDIKKYYEDFNEIFFVKFYEYIKKIVKEIEKEKIKNDKYINYITLLKKRINALKIEINKTKKDIESLNRFAILNAKIKLKKLSLPKYYLDIFENNFNDLNKLNITQEVINTIKKYKTNINYDEMLSLLDKYENDALNLLTEYNCIKNDINILNKQKKNLANNFTNKNSYLDESINDKINLVEKLKAKYEELDDNKNSLINYVNKNINIITEKDSANKIRKSIVSFNYNKLYIKTINIYNNLNEYINHDFTNVKIPKAKEGIHSIILYYLSLIEKLIIILIEKVNKYIQEDPDKNKTFKMMIEKSRKIRKESEQKKKNELSIKLKKKKIEEKNKKIITTTRMNIYNYYGINVINKYKKKQKAKKVINIETIFDYLKP